MDWIVWSTFAMVVRHVQSTTASNHANVFIFILCSRIEEASAFSPRACSVESLTFVGRLGERALDCDVLPRFHVE